MYCRWGKVQAKEVRRTPPEREGETEEGVGERTLPGAGAAEKGARVRGAGAGGDRTG